MGQQKIKKVLMEKKGFSFFEASRLLREGRVFINERPASARDTFDCNVDTLTIDGEPVELEGEKLVHSFALGQTAYSRPGRI